MLPDVVRDEMQICVAYLVCEKREEEEEEEYFFFQWLASERRLVVDTKKKNLSLARTPRVRSLSSARVTRARLRILSSSKSRLNCEFQWTILDKFLVIIAGKNSRERQKKERYKKTKREKPLSESVFKKHHHDL